MAMQQELDTGVKITQKEVERVKGLIGVELRIDSPYLTEATKDAIRHWAWGIGDVNPLWSDEEYAKKTRWGGIIAPPTILFNFGNRPSLGFAGLHGLWAEDIWEWSLPIRVNDRITCSAKLVEVTEKPSKLAGRTIQQVIEHLYKNQSGKVVCKRHAVIRRYERATAKERGAHAGVTMYHYRPEEIKAIEADYDKEEIRGANPRYWEGVKVGDEISNVVKGPLTVTDYMAFCMGWGGSPFIRAHRRALEYRRRHPRGATLNPYGIPDAPERVHWEEEFAREVGAPAPFDYGFQRVAWAAHLMTNWMGDDGFLKRLHVQIRTLNLLGDTLWYKGKVTRKYTEGAEHLVDCEFWADNQRKERTTTGSATVVLPVKK